jgi:hypothetical protein
MDGVVVNRALLLWPADQPVSTDGVAVADAARRLYGHDVTWESVSVNRVDSSKTRIVSAAGETVDFPDGFAVWDVRFQGVHPL